MIEAVNRFYNSIEKPASLTQAALAELFVYFLTVEGDAEHATAKQVADCFVACDLSRPANIGVALSAGTKTKPARLLRVDGGFKLQRHMREALSKKLGAETITAQTSATLRGLEHKVPVGSDKEFLKEAIDCFEAGANRATIVMVWILVVDHLYHYIMAHRLPEFNVALAADKGVKLATVSSRDDFNEIKETKFIELCRASGIISNDVRKVLDLKLGIRNSSAHPSSIKIGRLKVIEFVEDLVENIVLKYKL